MPTDDRPIPPPPGYRSRLRQRVSSTLGRGISSTRSAAKRARARVRRTRPTADGIVTVEYTPRLDGDPDPGEVVWTWIPFEEDPTQGKDRPVVVIGRRGEHLVGVPLTSRRNDREPQVPIGTGSWDSKRRASYARIWRMTDFDPDRMRREGSILERRKFDAVVAAVDRHYDVRYGDGPGTG